MNSASFVKQFNEQANKGGIYKITNLNSFAKMKIWHTPKCGNLALEKSNNTIFTKRIRPMKNNQFIKKCSMTSNTFKIVLNNTFSSQEKLNFVNMTGFHTKKSKTFSCAIFSKQIVQGISNAI